jgi:dihydrofolate reductase
MAKLSVFNSVTLDGYFSGPDGDISWAKTKQDPEWTSFISENAKGGGVLIFGRKTYDLMKSYWPTPEARKNDPVVAERMNNLPKVVFSKTLDSATWNNTKLLNGNLSAEIRRMKEESGDDMTIMGSGTIVSQLANEGLIDEYQIVLTPVVLGEGRTMFDGIKDNLPFKLTKSRTFANGNVFLRFEPEKERSSVTASSKEL